MIAMNPDTAWLRALADKDDNGVASVGGLVAALAGGAAPLTHLAERLALAKLVELRRRQYHLSVEDLARQAGVELEDLLALERGQSPPEDPRVIDRLARVLQLPQPRLRQLAGWAPPQDDTFRKATVRFAARSEPVADLRPDEREALDEYVKALAGS